MMLKIALIALVAFAAAARAQMDDDEFKGKQENLEDRGGYNNREGWNGEEEGWKGGKRGLGLGKGLGGLKRGALEGGLLEGGLEGGFEGNRGLGGLEGGNRGLGNIEGIEVDIANQVETNKVVPGIVEVAPTVETNSNSVRVIGSTKVNNLVQNSNSQVVQNNVVKSTDIHVHTDTLVKQPKTVNKFLRRHHTEKIINTQPIKTNINVERKQLIIRPEVENLVIYQNTESLRRNRRPTIVRNEQKFEQLPTIREATRNDGTEVIGNPINAGSANLLTLGNLRGNGNGLGLNNGFEGGLNRGNGLLLEGEGKGLRLGGNYRKSSRSHGGSYGLKRRSGEKQEDEEEKVEEHKPEEEHVEEATN